MEILLELQKYAQQPITTQILLGVLKEYSRPFDKINELTKQGYLLQIRRGLYILGDQLNVKRPELNLISNHLYGPSYISLETSLFFWGLIPEKVYVTSAMTIKQSNTFDTQLGKFTFHHLPSEYYSYGIQSVKLTDKQTILIASPEKSLCDKIINTSGVTLRSKKGAYEFLVEDLRIDTEMLTKLDVKQIESWISKCEKRSSIEKILELIQSL